MRKAARTDLSGVGRSVMSVPTGTGTLSMGANVLASDEKVEFAFNGLDPER